MPPASQPPASGAPTRYQPLAVDDPELLGEIEGLQLRARQVVHGALAGVHRSLRRGTSIEFSEHKRYTPGDEIRHIDWRAYAKTDRYHVKQFEDETNLTIELLLDHSGSMQFASAGRPSKLDYGRTLASALSYLALRQGDATGLLTFADEVTGELPPRSSSTHLMEILARLARLEARNATGIRRCVDFFAQSRRRKAVAILISDLFDPDPELWDAFRRLSARRHDVAVLQLIDSAELDFPFENPSLFVSMEDERRLFVHPRVLRQAFIAEMRKFLEQTARTMAEIGVDYHCIDTRTQPAPALATFLRSRDRKR